MNKIKLGDVMDVKRGTSLSGDYYSTSGDLVRLTLGNFKYPDCGFKPNTAKDDIYFVGEVKPEYIMKKGDIITPLTEQVKGLLGNTATIPESDKYIQSGDIGKIIPDESMIDKRFSYYLVSSPTVKKQLSAASQQTKIRHTSPDKIKDCIAFIPDLYQQKKIAHLLDTINLLIQTNDSAIKQLESLAKTIYDYWFLQFEFPNEDGKPYKSSGGKMVWNDELKREIPEGWGEISLDKIADMKTVSITPIQTEMYNHYSIPAYDTFKTPTVENGKDINSNKYLVYENCILVSKLNPHFKRIWNIYSINEKSICSTEFMPFLSINGHKEFLYSILNSDAFYRFTINNSNSSTGSRKRMQPEAYKDFKLAYPLNDNKVISKFCDVTRGMLKQQDSLIKENQELISLRDFLLPMLMNGQVTFKEEA